MLKSHPDQALGKHLYDVWQIMQRLLAERETKVWDRELLEALLPIIAFSHDFGKATSYFQRYINADDIIRYKRGEEERHGALSAVVGYFLAKNYLEEIRHDETLKLSFFVYLAIKHHHGNLQDITNDYARLSDKEIRLLEKQIASVDMEGLNATYTELLKLLPNKQTQIECFSINILKGWVSSINAELKKVGQLYTPSIYEIFGAAENKDYRLDDYFKFLLLYSLLLDADKYQAGIRADLPFERSFLPADVVDKYKTEQMWKESPLNQIRQQAYQEADSNLALSDIKQIFSLTLPTGAGKTLAAYNYAFKLREKRGKERGIIPRIIYALPFTSVIDQNYEVMHDILQAQGVLRGQNVLLKHHYLADQVYAAPHDSDELEYGCNAAKLLVEGWASEIVVTTFVQLFETLIGWRNSNLRRFHRLAHSIIILDEIQAMPVPYWELTQQMLVFLTANMAVDVILVTATQPQIFTGAYQDCQLVQAERYFAMMERVRMEINLGKRTIQEFVENEVKEQILLNPDKSFLFILNTVNAAQEVYRLIKAITNEEIVFLSTGVIMKQRKERIREIREGKYRIAVTTQLVEAGVDITFDVVYRDLAPMDSLNQAGGRCNRHGDKDIGVIRVIKLFDDKSNRFFANMIYSDIALKITEDILKKHSIISEKEFLNLINEYFMLAKDRTNAKKSLDILAAIQDMCFFSNDETKNSISGFRWIEENIPKVSVFVELDSEAQDVWRKYEQIVEIKDFYARQAQFLNIKSKFYEYVISVPANKKYDLPPEVNYFRYISSEDLERYYNREFGYDSKGAPFIY